jgi:hypothetical protein
MKSIESKKLYQKVRTESIQAYNSIMPTLYINNKEVNQNVIRLLFLEAITNHISDKTRLALQGKVRRKVKVVEKVVFQNPSESIKAVEISFGSDGEIEELFLNK